MGAPQYSVDTSWWTEMEREAPAASKYAKHFDGLIQEHFEFVRENAELFAENFDLTKQVEQLQAELTAERERTRAIESRRSFLIDYQNATFEKAASYTTLIASVGYVGLLTAWTNSVTSITYAQNRMVGALTVISLAAFILWEMAKMLRAARTVGLAAKATSAPDERFDARVAKWSKFHDWTTEALRRSWPYQFTFCSITAFLAAAILVASLAERSFF